jgi:hypothetical protein
MGLMADAWFLHDGKQQAGPFGIAELTVVLAAFPDPRQTLVWREGFDSWKKAGSIPELANRLAPATPQPPPLSPERELRGGPQIPDAGIAPEDPLPEAPEPHRLDNFIAQSWRGEYPLWVSYWIFGFLGGIVAGAIALAASHLLTADKGYQPLSIFASMTIVWLAVFAVSTWQLVAVWRSAGRRIRERARMGKYALWAGLAKVAVVFGCLRLVGDFANTGLPPLTEAFRVAFLDDPGLPAYSIRVMRNGTEAEITGGFKYGLTEDFSKVLRASPDIKVVHLNSYGGRIGEAESLGKVIRERGLITYTSSTCQSACTIAFAGGRERWIHQRAQLGFHTAAFPGMGEAEMATDTAEAYRAAGFDAGFITRVLATPHEDMWTPSVDELRRANVITAVSMGNDFAASGLGGDIGKEGFAAHLTKHIAALQTLKQKLPDAYRVVIDACYASYEAGQTDNEMNAAATAEYVRVVRAYRSLADDAVLVEFARLIADELEFLATKSATACYRRTLGIGDEDDDADFPESMRDRAFALSKHTMATAAARPTVAEDVRRPLWSEVARRLKTRGHGADAFQFLEKIAVEPDQHAAYCIFIVAFLREITALDEHEAALLLRNLWARNERRSSTYGSLPGREDFFFLQR